MRPFRALVRRIIASGERLLHPLRRRRLVMRLARNRTDTILFVCLGNICRSPYAERRLEAALNRRSPTVESAGFIRPGRTSPDPAVRIAADRGVDLCGHRSRVVSPDVVERADVIFVMSARQRRRLRREFGRKEHVYLFGDLDPGSPKRRTISDPFDRGDDVYESVFDRIDRCCAVLGEAKRVSTKEDPPT